MNRQEFLENKLRQQREYKQIIIESKTMAMSSINSGEFNHLLIAAEILVKAQDELNILAKEILSIREEIENETKDIL